MIERYGLVLEVPAMVARTSRVRRCCCSTARGVIRWAMFTENFRVRVHPDALLAAIKRFPACKARGLATGHDAARPDRRE